MIEPVGAKRNFVLYGHRSCLLCFVDKSSSALDDEDDGNMMYMCPIVIDNKDCTAASHSHMKLMAHIQMAHKGRHLIVIFLISNSVVFAEVFFSSRQGARYHS